MFILMFTLLISFNSMAFDIAEEDKLIIDKTVDNLILSELIGLKHLDPRCDDDSRPPRGGCLEAVCSKLPSYRCDEPSELRRVNQMCSQVRSGACITNVCAKLPSYRCDEFSELESVAKICSEVPSSGIDAICSYLPSYRCDELSELNSIANMLKSTTRRTIECLKASCSRLPSYKCDELSELKYVLDSCQS